jgi:hypothetical protein
MNNKIKLEIPVTNWTLICDDYTSYCYADKEAHYFINMLCEKAKLFIKETEPLTHQAMISIELTYDEFIHLYEDIWWSTHEGYYAINEKVFRKWWLRNLRYLYHIKRKYKLSSRFDKCSFKDGCCPKMWKKLGIILEKIYENK